MGLTIASITTLHRGLQWDDPRRASVHLHSHEKSSHVERASLIRVLALKIARNGLLHPEATLVRLQNVPEILIHAAQGLENPELLLPSVQHQAHP
ncbi:MAG: hypothetical protein ACK55I_46285, partial [bacterium]